MTLIQSWRWYGPNDPVSLQDIRQAGASGIVSALHHIPHGEVWPVSEIDRRKQMIEDAGLQWVVVESLPVHEAIKTNSAEAVRYLENYRQSLRNLAACDLRTVCYNFMPVLDWTRTDLTFPLDNGAKALRLDWTDLAFFDLFLLKRPGAETSYSEAILDELEKRKNTYTPDKVRRLESIICMGVPTEGSVTIQQLKESLHVYDKMGKDGLREHLKMFLLAIGDICKEEGIQMTLHPDDPPFPILGLPRIASSVDDLRWIVEAVDDPFNGICFCTGSLGASPANDLPEMLSLLGDRVGFAHLRNVRRDSLGNFHESDHLDGDVDMYVIMNILTEINEGRKQPIPFRPDHGHQMLDDLDKTTNPGYSAIGRLKGLAELRGLEMGIIQSKRKRVK